MGKKAENTVKPSISLMLIDGESLVHRAYYAYSNGDRALKTADGRLSGGFYGFFSMLLTRLRRYKPTRFTVCWGDRRSNLHRLKLCPEYKSNRGSKPLDLVTQMNDVKLALLWMGVEQYWSDGYEGDDVIAFLSSAFLKNATPESKLIVVTSDKDMLQLVCDRLMVLSPGNSGDVEFTPKKVIEKFSVKPEFIPDYLTLVGDESDGIMGVKGVGDVTAWNLLNEYGPIKQWFNTIEDLPVLPHIKKSLLESREVMVRNKKLISLKNVNLELREVDDLEGDFTCADDVFDRYDMKKTRPSDFSEFIPT